MMNVLILYSMFVGLWAPDVSNFYITGLEAKMEVYLREAWTEPT